MGLQNLTFLALTIATMLGTACAPKSFSFTYADGYADCNGFNQSCTKNEDGDNEFDYTVVSDDAIPQNKVDILFVIDNSKSMAPEQQKMAARFSTFMSSLSGIDWRIAITNTDIYGNNGSLRPFNDGSTILRSSSSNPNGQFQVAVQMGESLDPRAQDERGIYAANLVVERGGPNFIRNNSHLAVVVLSDEDERSDGGRSTSLDPKYDTPQSLIENIKSRLGGSKSFAFHSIIIAPGDNACYDFQDQNQNGGGKFGETYAQLSQMTGGVVGNICASDYGSQLSTIGQKIQAEIKSIPLACSPKGGVIQVTFNPAPNPAITHSLNGNKLTLSRAPNPGTHIRLKYKCVYTALN